MSTPIVIAIYLVAVGFCLGLLPERRRYLPALPLVALGPMIVLWIAALYGLDVGALWALALAGLYRAPLSYWLRRFIASARSGGGAGQAG